MQPLTTHNITDALRRANQNGYTVHFTDLEDGAWIVLIDPWRERETSLFMNHDNHDWVMHCLEREYARAPLPNSAREANEDYPLQSRHA